MDETARVVEACATFFTTEGRRTAMRSTIRAITKRKPAEAALRQAHDALASRVQARTQLSRPLEMGAQETHSPSR